VDVFAIGWLPYDAYLSADAIARTAVRVLGTGRELLEWQTASDAQRGAAGTGGFLPFDVGSTGGGAGRRRSDWLFHFKALVVAAPVITLWLVHDHRLVAKPADRSGAAKTSDEDLLFLRTAARRTWRFFETFVGPPTTTCRPTTFRKIRPRAPRIARRRRNTRAGAPGEPAAYDFGYISSGEVIERTGRTLTSVEKLKRFPRASLQLV